MPAPSRRFVLAVLAAGAALAPTSLAAQGGVSVTPDGSTTPERPAYTGGYSARFTVQNTGQATDLFLLSCAGLFNVTCTGLSQNSVTLPAGGRAFIFAYYDVGQPGTGTLELTALSEEWLISDDGYYYVPVVLSGTPGPPTVALRNYNRDFVDRSACLTLGAGEAAAVQCGDLLVAHAMPGYRTLGRERSLTLLYNSATARARPMVAAAVTIPTGTLPPDDVYAELRVDSVTRASATYASWSAGETRQIALAFDAVSENLSTGLHELTLEIQNRYASGNQTTTVNDTLIVVRRDASEFGAGWYLAGVEWLGVAPYPNPILWVGGDGSAKVYHAAVIANTWVAAAGAYRDTLMWNGSQYVRTLRHGVQVKFDTTGRHVQTVNRVGHATTFTWTSGKLTSIVVPPAGQPGATYTLVYSGGLLDRITDPAGRVLDATVSGGNLTQLTDPDGQAVLFAYDGVRRMTGRRTRGQVWWRWEYWGRHVRLIRDPTNCSSCDYEQTRVYHWDDKGYAFGIATGTQTAVDTALAYTKVDGPRWWPVSGDTTLFWVDRWGAPTRIRDPLGYVTSLTRGDAAHTALVTRIAYPDGRIVGAAYNARGNVWWVADSTHEGSGVTTVATTSYAYNSSAAPDSPTMIRTPVDTTTIAYHATLGLPTAVTAQSDQVTTFEYFTTGGQQGLIWKVTEHDVRVVDTLSWTKTNASLETRFEYDAKGNDTLVVSPSGASTRYERDVYGRVWHLYDPLNHRTDYTYDLMNRVTAVQMPGLLQPTQYRYSASGTLDTVIDPRQVMRRWVYDAADRPILEIDDVGNAGNWWYGPSGLTDSVRTRNGSVIHYSYDAAGRQWQVRYPGFLNDFTIGGSYYDHIVPGDTVTRTFDAMGRLVSATGTRGSITRTYNREGTLRTERQIVKDANGQVVSDFTPRYWYDTGNRRTRFFNGTDTLRYVYGADGRLATLTVDWQLGGFADDVFEFFWDGLGRRDSLVYHLPNNHWAKVSFGYDRTGLLRMISSHTDTWFPQNGFEYSLRHLSVDPDGHILSTADAWGDGHDQPVVYEYDARHQMTRRNSWRYDYDDSGNRTATRTTSDSLVDSLQYWPTSNRLLYRHAADGTVMMEYRHHPGGARLEEDVPFAPSSGERMYDYDALERTVGHWVQTPTQYIHSWCDLDVLGRRVGTCGASGGGWMGFDGDNVIRGASSSAVIWRYAHGPGLDDPLVAVYKYGSSYQRYYYLTDGAGRQLAFTNEGAEMYTSQPVYTTNGGNQAGAIAASTGFDNSRAPSVEIPQLSFYRHRYYDQSTGRFTQEDPIGIAGGINLYQYAGNNPASFTDPFGLCPPTDTNVDDCLGTSLGHAWWAIDASGVVGRRLIADVVEGSISVQTLSLSALHRIAGCSSTQHSCWDPGSSTIYLNSSMTPGVMAVSIAHEHAHSTEDQAYSYYSYATNELRAWDATASMGWTVPQPYRRQAIQEFGAVFNALTTFQGRDQVIRIMMQRAAAQWPGFPRY